MLRASYCPNRASRASRGARAFHDAVSSTASASRPCGVISHRLESMRSPRRARSATRRRSQNVWQ